MLGIMEVVVFSPNRGGCSDRVLWEVHCGVWRRSWQSSWASSLTPSHRTNGPGPASRSGTGPVSPCVPEVLLCLGESIVVILDYAVTA